MQLEKHKNQQHDYGRHIYAVQHTSRNVSYYEIWFDEKTGAYKPVRWETLRDLSSTDQIERAAWDQEFKKDFRKNHGEKPVDLWEQCCLESNRQYDAERKAKHHKGSPT